MREKAQDLVVIFLVICFFLGLGYFISPKGQESPETEGERIIIKIKI